MKKVMGVLEREGMVQKWQFRKLSRLCTQAGVPNGTAHAKDLRPFGPSEFVWVPKATVEAIMRVGQSSASDDRPPPSPWDFDFNKIDQEVDKVPGSDKWQISPYTGEKTPRHRLEAEHIRNMPGYAENKIREAEARVKPTVPLPIRLRGAAITTSRVTRAPQVPSLRAFSLWSSLRSLTRLLPKRVALARETPSS